MSALILLTALLSLSIIEKQKSVWILLQGSTQSQNLTIYSLLEQGIYLE